jgi:NitT/TauT family transport system substrate-binding protein
MIQKLSRFAVLLSFLVPGCGPGESQGGASGEEKTVIRVGHFPNLTHAHALVARALARKGKGWFEERLGGNVEIQWFTYNAGPSAMEAVFAGSIDLAYVGPNPALNAYIKSRGEEIRIIAGATVGGAALVVQDDDRIKAAADFRAKKVATPQLGNTQDVACRAWLKSHGFAVTQVGGDVSVLPTANPDQLALFQKKDIDAVWTVEPWVSRLEMEAGGKALVEERDALTTVLAARAAFVEKREDLARRFAEAHAELTGWIVSHPEEAQRLVREELREETTRDVSEDLVRRSWKRLTFTSEISRDPLERFVEAARDAGFIRETVDLSRLVQPLHAGRTPAEVKP